MLSLTFELCSHLANSILLPRLAFSLPFESSSHYLFTFLIVYIICIPSPFLGGAYCMRIDRCSLFSKVLPLPPGGELARSPRRLQIIPPDRDRGATPSSTSSGLRISPRRFRVEFLLLIVNLLVKFMILFSQISSNYFTYVN